MWLPWALAKQRWNQLWGSGIGSVSPHLGSDLLSSCNPAVRNLKEMPMTRNFLSFQCSHWVLSVPFLILHYPERHVSENTKNRETLSVHIPKVQQTPGISTPAQLFELWLIPGTWVCPWGSLSSFCRHCICTAKLRWVVPFLQRERLCNPLSCPACCVSPIPGGLGRFSPCEGCDKLKWSHGPRWWLWYLRACWL